MLMRCWDPPRAQHLTHRPLLCPPPAEFVRRKKTALWFVGALLAVSASILTVGLAATTRTENVTVGGYYPGIIVKKQRHYFAYKVLYSQSYGFSSSHVWL